MRCFLALLALLCTTFFYACKQPAGTTAPSTSYFNTGDTGVRVAGITQVQKGSFLYCPNGSHLSMWDDQQTYMNGVIDFIKKVDAGNL